MIVLHSTKHCHRDIKPANILFFDNNENPWKFGDYGTSKLYENNLGIYDIKGTNKYMPYEIRICEDEKV